MTDRERLIEILGENISEYCRLSVIAGTTKITGVTLDAYRLADHLIANGVTFAKDTNVLSWIPVSERFPESVEWVLCACRANIIEVLRYDRTMDDWDSTMPERCYMKGFVTHWMPLPEPPKEETDG